MRCVDEGSGVLRWVLDRPERANSYSDATLEAMHAELDRIDGSDSVRALVVSGAGRHFCAGADLEELAARPASDAMSLRSRAAFERIARLGIGTVAAIQGAAVGGGVELALACDFRIGAPAATFHLPEVEMGLLPAAGGIPRLVRAIGEPRAKQMVLLGSRVDAATAADWGLLHQVSHAPVEAALAVAKTLACLDGSAVRLAKALFESTAPEPPELEKLAQYALYARRPGRTGDAGG